MNRALVRFAFFCTLVVSTGASASAWTRSPGSAYLNLSYSRIRATQYRGIYGSARPNIEINTYIQQQVALYSEVGILERYLTALLDWQVWRHSSLAGFGH